MKPFAAIPDFSCSSLSCALLEVGEVKRPRVASAEAGINSQTRNNVSLSSITATMVISCTVSVFASVTYGYALGYSSPVQPQIVKDLGLSQSQYSLFGSILTIGGLLGAVVCGKVTDYLGRRRALWMIDGFSILGWFIIAVSKEAWLLHLGRLLVGFALGLAAYVVPIYIAEITPEKLRGGFVFVHMLMICTGITMVYLLGIVIPWRILALIGMIPNVLQAIGVFFVPESPRWLVKMKRHVEFEFALRRLRGANADISKEVALIKDFTLASEQMETVNILQLFQKKYARLLIVAAGLMALSQLCGYPGIIYYASDVFESAGFSGRIGTILVAAIQIPTCLVALVLMDRCGRRPLMIISTVGLSLGCLLGGLSFVLQDQLTKLSPFLMLIGVLLFSAMYAIGMGGTVDLILAEIFPMNVKGLGGSVSTLVGWSASWIVTYAFNFSMDWSHSGTFLIFTAISTFTVLFIALLVPETKGRTLEEIHASMIKA